MRKCIDEGKSLGELSLDELKKLSLEFDESFYEIVDVDAAVARKVSFGGAAPQQVASQLENAGKRLKDMQQALRELEE